MNSAPNTLRYWHIYLPMFPFIWFGLAMDGSHMAELLPNNQWLTNISTMLMCWWIYRNVSMSMRKIMRYGLALALAGEFVFAILLEMYSYRLGNLPLYVPFGHVGIYASVYYLAKEPLFRQHQQAIVSALYTLMIIYSTAWLIFAGDVLGFICMLYIVWIFRRHPGTKPYFLLMFFTIAYLELVGTYYGCWQWPPHWFGLIEWVPSANPPSGISVFYFGFDLGCLWLYKRFNRHKWQRVRSIGRLRSERLAGAAA